MAWLRHFHRNKHHYQWWIVPDAGKLYPKPMTKSCIKEMICDWIGAGKAQGHNIPIVQRWDSYNQNLTFHPSTRRKVERVIEKIRRGEKWDTF